jgi:hypothetical protein
MYFPRNCIIPVKFGTLLVFKYFSFLFTFTGTWFSSSVVKRLFWSYRFSQLEIYIWKWRAIGVLMCAAVGIGTIHFCWQPCWYLCFISSMVGGGTYTAHTITIIYGLSHTFARSSQIFQPFLFLFGEGGGEGCNPALIQPYLSVQSLRRHQDYDRRQNLS